MKTSCSMVVFVANVPATVRTFECPCLRTRGEVSIDEAVKLLDVRKSMQGHAKSTRFSQSMSVHAGVW